MEYAIIFLPLLGSILGYLGRKLVKYFAEITTSLFVSLSAIFSIILFWKGLQTGSTVITKYLNGLALAIL